MVSDKTKLKRLLRDKTKRLDIRYNIYLKCPTEENKQVWFKIMKGSD